MTDNQGFVEEEKPDEAQLAHFYLEKDEESVRSKHPSGQGPSNVPRGLPRHLEQRVKSVSDPEFIRNGTQSMEIRGSYQKNMAKHIKNKGSVVIPIEKEDGTQTSIALNSRRSSLFQTLRKKIMHQPITDFGVQDVKSIEEDGETASACCCASWTRFVDTMGNRQTQFCYKLRELRPTLIDAKLALIKFGAELERELRPGPDDVCTKMAAAINEINQIICDSSLNITPKDSSQMRMLTDELAILLRVCTEVVDHWKLIQEMQSRPSDHNITGAHGPAAVETKDGIDAIEKIDKHSLKERITRNVNMIELQLIFIDKKCERRWWLKDLIRVLQAVMKLMLFISASISVAYHYNQTYPIVTLALTIAHGIIELLDQLFVQRFDPKDISLQSPGKSGTKPVPA